MGRQLVLGQASFLSYQPSKRQTQCFRINKSEVYFLGESYERLERGRDYKMPTIPASNLGDVRSITPCSVNTVGAYSRMNVENVENVCCGRSWNEVEKVEAPPATCVDIVESLHTKSITMTMVSTS